MIEFPIYKSEINKPRTFQIVILGISFLLMYFLFPTIQSIIVLITIITFVLFLMLTEKRKRPTGKIYLNNHQIKVITEENEFQIDLSNIDRLELIYSGYKGKRIIGDFIPKFNTFSGIDNYIKINMDKFEFKYKFFVENEIQENGIIELIRNWEIHGYDISNIKINK